MNINLECEDDNYYNKFLREASPRTNYGEGYSENIEELKKRIIMTRYNLFRQIEKLCTIEKTGEFRYNKMIQSGNLVQTHWDYGRGYYDVSIYYIFSNNIHFCRIYFGTIDDGDFGSWTERKSKEKAIELIEKAKDIFSEMVVCPEYNELNLLFRDLGIYFCNE